MGDLLDDDAAAFAAAARDHRENAIPRTPISRRRSPLLRNLLIAFGISVPMVVVGAFFMCGFYGCGWGGPNSTRMFSYALCIAIGVTFALAVNEALRGERGARDRALTSTAVGASAGVVGFLLMTVMR